MKKMLTGLGVAVFIIVLAVLCVSGLDYVLCDDVSAGTRLMLHEMYEQDKIDSVFLGTSHVYKGINPAITDAAWNENTFICGSASQNINSSYALLKEAHKSGDIDTCYLELSIRKVNRDKQAWQKQTTAAFIVADYMKPSSDRVSYLLDAVESKDYVNAFCRARRNWKNIYSLDTMKDIVSRKRTDAYRNYDGTVKNYEGKGFFPVAEKFDRITDNGTITITDNYMSEDYLMYFQKIVNYCRENDIELICFTSPIPECTMEQIKNYDSFDAQMRDVCEEYGVPFYDFNLADPSILDLKDDDFSDWNHLSDIGADKFTKVFADFFSGDIEEEELFYDSYSEKKEDLPKRLLGLYMKRDQGAETCKIRAVSTKEETYMYEAWYLSEDDRYELLKEKSKEKTIAMPTKDKVTLKIIVYDGKNKKVGEFEHEI